MPWTVATQPPLTPLSRAPTLPPSSRQGCVTVRDSERPGRGLSGGADWRGARSQSEEVFPGPRTAHYLSCYGK